MTLEQSVEKVSRDGGDSDDAGQQCSDNQSLLKGALFIEVWNINSASKQKILGRERDFQ